MEFLSKNKSKSKSESKGKSKSESKGESESKSKSKSESESKSSSKRIKKYKNTYISKALLNKLEKIRIKIKQDNDLYISKEHKKMCNYYKKYQEFTKKEIKIDNEKEKEKQLYYYNKYQELYEKTEIIEKEVNLKFITDTIGQMTQKRHLLEYLNSEPRSKYLPFNYTNYNYKINYNKYNHKFINNLQKFLNFDIIQDFLQEQDKFIKSLSMRELYNLKHYTFQGDTLIIKFLNNEFNISQLLIAYSISTLLYFQFNDYFKKNPIFKGNRVNYRNSEAFIEFLNSNYHNFSMEIYEYVLTLYIEELQEIFKKAPKINHVLYVYRGVEDNYINKEVSKNKSKGYFISKRFISTSLIPEIAINYSLKSINKILYEIKIEKGTPVIFLAGISFFKNEMEVLLPIDTTLYIDYASKKVKYYENKRILCDIEEDIYISELSMTSLVTVPSTLV